MQIQCRQCGKIYNCDQPCVFTCGCGNVINTLPPPPPAAVPPPARSKYRATVTCPNCGAQAYRGAKVCINCKAKLKKGQGALVAVVLLFVIIGACSHLVSGESKPQKNDVDDGKTVFKNNVAVSFAQSKLKNKSDYDIRFVGSAQVMKLKGSFNETLGFKGDLYEIKQEFEFLNKKGFWQKAHYRGVVEFLSGRGYRVTLLQVNGEQIFPALQ